MLQKQQNYELIIMKDLDENPQNFWIAQTYAGLFLIICSLVSS